MYIGTGLPFFRPLASVFFYLFPGIYLYRAVKTFRKDVYARFLVLFFGLVFLAGVAFTLRRYFDLPLLSFFDISVLRLASVVEIVGISFAIKVPA